MFNIHSFCILLALACFATSLPVIEEVSASTPNAELAKPEEPTTKKAEDTETVKTESEANNPAEIALAAPQVETKYIIDNSTNGTSKDLYVIRTVVYEIGILTDADNSTSNDTESHEQVDLTFFDPKHNGSLIDLSNIPVPIQTNISGVSVTGIAPANLGTIQLAQGDEPATLLPNFPLQVPLLPNALITVRHNISTTNADKEAELLNNLPTLLGLTSPITGEPLRIESSTDQIKVESENADAKKEGDEKPVESLNTVATSPKEA